MKKIILIFFIIFSFGFGEEIKEISNELDTKIRDFIKREYNIDEYGNTMQKMMYQSEIKNVLWILNNVKKDDSENFKIYQRVLKDFPPNEFGYTMIRMMYEQELKNKDW